MLALRFPESRLRLWAERYSYVSDIDLDLNVIPFLEANRYLSKPLFLKLCRWKSPRTQARCASNDKELIEDVTRISLSHQNKIVRLQILTLLKGVSWPTASVILHFGHRYPYPILDFRALWSLGLEGMPKYTFDLWWAYVESCRDLAVRNNLDMRTLDKALWQYSKENQD